MDLKKITTTVNARGVVTGTYTLPARVPAGKYTIALTGSTDRTKQSPLTGEKAQSGGECDHVHHCTVESRQDGNGDSGCIGRQVA